MPYRVLFITTSTDRIGDDGPETGFDWQSLAMPYWRLREAGVDIGFASIRGGKPPGDPGTAGEPRYGAVDMFLGAPEAVTALANSIRVADAQADAWSALLITGGHGGLWDLAQSPDLADLVTGLWAQGGIVAALGAGTAGLINAKAENGSALVSGKRVASRRDRTLVDLPGGPPPLLPASALTAKGAELQFAVSEDDAAVIEDGRLITAQNAGASADLALQLLDALDVYCPSLSRGEAPAR